MKPFFLLFLSFLVFCSAQAQKTKQKPFAPDKYGYVKDPKFHKLIKERGYQLVGKYDTFNCRPLVLLANALLNGEWIKIDVNGKPFETEQTIFVEDFVSIGKVDEGSLEAPAHGGYDDGYGRNAASFVITLLNNKYGTKNEKTGKEGLPPIYDRIKMYSNTMVFIWKDKKQGLAYIDGKIILEPEFDQVLAFSVYLGVLQVRKNNKVGLADTAGNIIIPIVYDKLQRCHIGQGNKIYLKTLSNGSWGLLNPQGEELLLNKYQEIVELNTGLVKVKTHAPFMYGLADTTGKMLLEPVYSNFYIRDEHIIILEKGKLKGWAALDGKILLEPVYTEIEHARNGLVRVEKDGKWGLIKMEEKFEISPSYSYFVIAPVFNYLWVHKDKNLVEARDSNGRSGILDLKGDTVISFNYTGLEIIDTLFFFEKNGRGVWGISKTMEEKKGEYGLMDKHEKVLKTFDYDEMTYMDKYFIVKKDSKEGVIDLNWNIIIPIKYDAIYEDPFGFMREGIIWAEINGRQCKVDRYGNECFGACGK